MVYYIHLELKLNYERAQHNFRHIFSNPILWKCALNSPYMGAFTIYVDQFSKFLDPSLPIGRPFIYWGLFSKVDICLTPPSLSLVYVDCKCPLVVVMASQLSLDPISKLKDRPQRGNFDPFSPKIASLEPNLHSKNRVQ